MLHCYLEHQEILLKAVIICSMSRLYISSPIYIETAWRLLYDLLWNIWVERSRWIYFNVFLLRDMKRCNCHHLTLWSDSIGPRKTNIFTLTISTLQAYMPYSIPYLSSHYLSLTYAAFSHPFPLQPTIVNHFFSLFFLTLPFPVYTSCPTPLPCLYTHHKQHGDDDGIRPVWSAGDTSLTIPCFFRASSSPAVCLSQLKEFFSVSVLLAPSLEISSSEWWLIFSEGRQCSNMRCLWWFLLPSSRWVRTLFVWMLLLLLTQWIMPSVNQLHSRSVTESAY